MMIEKLISNAGEGQGEGKTMAMLTARPIEKSLKGYYTHHWMTSLHLEVRSV